MTFFMIQALLGASFVLSVKILSCILHGPEMKKLTVKITATEGTYESSFQLFMLVHLLLKRKIEISLTTVNAVISSVLVIAKGGSEYLLTFGEQNKLEDKPVLKKIAIIKS